MDETALTEMNAAITQMIIDHNVNDNDKATIESYLTCAFEQVATFINKHYPIGAE